MNIPVQSPHPASTELPIIEQAVLHIYQMYDVCNAIDLERARSLMTESSARMRPVVTRGASIEIPHLPLTIDLGTLPVQLEEHDLTGTLRARIYDLGIISFDLAIQLPANLSWDQATAFMGATQVVAKGLIDRFEYHLHLLQDRLFLVLEKPNDVIRTEDYNILLVEQISQGIPASTLASHPALLQTALGEKRKLSVAAGNLANTLSYYENDCIVITWTSAIIIEPDIEARDDAIFLIEFVNVQLLAFRSYDAEVTRDLQRIIPRIRSQRRRSMVNITASSRFLHEIQMLIAETREFSERIENALKVTEDVYWNRVYMAAITALRVNTWRAGIEETLAVLHQSAAMLNDEAEAVRSTLLEALVIALILLELIVAIISLRH